MDEGCELMLRMAREAGFQTARRVNTDGYPGVLATLDAGAARTFGLVFHVRREAGGRDRVAVAPV